MKVYIETYGCTYNKADSQIIAGILEKENIKVVDSIDEADVIILNTCYVKQPTEHKIINRIRELQNTYKSKELIVAGCMVEIDPEKLKKIAPESAWLGPHKLHKAPEVVKSVINGNKKKVYGKDSKIKVEMPKKRFNSHVHIVQICEGCLGNCSYCCTRFARGRLYSYPLDSIVKDVKKAIEDGCVEIQLTAQDTAAYGRDIGCDLPTLINKITSLDGKFKIRVGMMHPKNVKKILDELVDAYDSEKIYKFLHLPVQSGSDKVLRDMNRGYKVKDFKKIVRKFRKKIPEISIATDIIVGFPTESREDFKKTCELLNEIKPNFIHSSRYAHRPGAKSSKLDELDHNEVKERSRIIEEIKNKIMREENKKLVGTEQKVLIVEKGKKGGYIGRTSSYIPVIVNSGKPGEIIKVKIKEATSTYLKGDAVGRI